MKHKFFIALPLISVPIPFLISSCSSINTVEMQTSIWYNGVISKSRYKIAPKNKYKYSVTPEQISHTKPSLNLTEAAFGTFKYVDPEYEQKPQYLKINSFELYYNNQKVIDEDIVKLNDTKTLIGFRIFPDVKQIDFVVEYSTSCDDSLTQIAPNLN